MNRIRSAALLAAFAGAFFVSSASAADGGFYLGIGAGQGTIRDNPANPNGAGTINFDSEDTSYKPSPATGWVRCRCWISHSKAAISISASLRRARPGSAWNTSSMASTAPPSPSSLGPVDLYGKLGALYWSSDKSIGGSTSSKTGSSAFYGVGVGCASVRWACAPSTNVSISASSTAWRCTP
jgi:hypothetical protein